MLDLDLVHSFVAVVETRSFTRAAARVNRTQSTVSQQIRKLEDMLGATLLRRTTAPGHVQLTEDGERLLPYAHRLLALAREAEQVTGMDRPAAIIRLGLPEDIPADRLTRLLRDFAGTHSGVRVDTVCGLTTSIAPLLAAGDLDLALVKRDVGAGPCLAAWPEDLVWVGARAAPPVSSAAPLPLAAFPQGCLYRARAIHALEVQGRPWRIAYASASLTGILAAVSSGLAVSLLARSALPPTLRVLDAADGFPAVPPTELALVAARGRRSPASSALAEHIERWLSDSADVSSAAPSSMPCGETLQPASGFDVAPR